jgi:hypothetical protein
MGHDMKKVCSWCNIDMGTVSVESHFENAVTHGICRECVTTFFGPRQVNLIDFLDNLDAKVIVVNSKAIIANANKQARDFLHKESKEIEGFMGGDVFECAFAKLPGGCGNTIHCDGCTIRNTVMDTFQTGKNHLKIPAYLIQDTPDKNKEIHFLISTEKVMDVVLLRVDTL